MILRALLLAWAFVWGSGAQAQTPAPRKAPAQRQVDDAQFRAQVDEATQAFQKGDFEATHAAAQRAVAEGTRVYGADHPNTAAAYNLIAAAFLRQGKFSEAEVNFRRVLTAYEKHLGASHENTAAALNNLALVPEKLGDYTGAETLLRRSLAIVEAKLGKQHPDTATTLSNLSRATVPQRISRVPELMQNAKLGGIQVRGLTVRQQTSIVQQETVREAKVTYDKLRSEMPADDITPDLFLYSALEEFLLYEDMKTVVEEMLRRQPGSEDVRALAAYVDSRLKR